MPEQNNSFTEVNRRRWVRYCTVFLVLLAALGAIMVLNINIGSVRISVAEIARAVGYESQSKLTKAFQDLEQISPTAYRRQQRENQG